MPGFVTFLFIAGIGAFLGSRYKPDAWSRHLRQPVWTPPDWAFAPVRAFLSLINAFAGWLVWWANADTFSVPLISQIVAAGGMILACAVTAGLSIFGF